MKRTTDQAGRRTMNRTTEHVGKQTVKRTTGLIGIMGHTYIADENHPGEKEIQYQFEIIRKLDGGRWLCQLFSFLDGRPTEVRAYPESFLSGDDVKLYALADEWHYAYEKECTRRRYREGTE
jgi:hypothetical protein